MGFGNALLNLHIFLCKHLKLHTRNGKEIACAFSSCQKLFSVRSLFASHSSRKHTKDTVACRDGGMDNYDSRMHDDAVVMGYDDLTETVEFSEVSSDVSRTRLALLYLRMQAKMLLPASTKSTLIEDFLKVCTTAMSQMFVRLHEGLSKLEIPDEGICNIIDGLSKEILSKMYNEGWFRSDTTRKTLFNKDLSSWAHIGSSWI